MLYFEPDLSAVKNINDLSVEYLKFNNSKPWDISQAANTNKKNVADKSIKLSKNWPDIRKSIKTIIHNISATIIKFKNVEAFKQSPVNRKKNNINKVSKWETIIKCTDLVGLN